ncbi:hypothetical protein [Paraburkholderia sacchari]|uniref:hypothetical protein n=1 Tax=Paraburkholderia sacchari TaxID=159450 RepID=UPI0005439369|nr:hypothetical protein [Paraburkholderia sacchari]NLP62112.1 hypothetical protein [Paraburkholderia sacchari]
MSLLVWIGSLEKPLLRDVLAGPIADAAGPERAPVRPGVAFLESSAPVGWTGAALLVMVLRMFVPASGACSRFGAAAGVALARAVPARGAARPCSFTAFAAPAAPRGLAAPARGDLPAAAFATFPAGARGAT